MPRRKQIRPTRMKYSEDGKVIKEEDDEAERDGSSGDDDDDDSDGEDTQQSDDASDDKIASDEDIISDNKNSEAMQPETEENLNIEKCVEKLDNFSDITEGKQYELVDNSENKDICNDDSMQIGDDLNCTKLRTEPNSEMNLLTSVRSDGDGTSSQKRKHSFDMEICPERDHLKNSYSSAHDSVMDLSAKRPKVEHSSGEVLPQLPKSNSYHRRDSNIDPAQPLDLSQKSSRKATPAVNGSQTSSLHRNNLHEPRSYRSELHNPFHDTHSQQNYDSRSSRRESRNSYSDSQSHHQREPRNDHDDSRSGRQESRSRHHSEKEQHGTAISPSLASLQQKFGSNLGYWYNGGYPQFPNMNYVFSHLKIPSHYDLMQYDKRSIEGWYGKVMPSINRPASRPMEIPKPVLPAAASRPVSHASVAHRSSPLTSSAPPTRPSTNLQSKPVVNISSFSDSKSIVKGNCIDFKCDCGKAYSTLYELSVHMQDTGHMPRNSKVGPSGDYPKLVRGQDMWLNSGSEQTKQILRCMQCGESFKSLPELTVHMMKTQHYADIFSSAHRKLHKCTTFFEKENDTKSVFKCRVCDTEYDTLDGLANHMVESKHHKKQGWRFQHSQEVPSSKPTCKVEPADLADERKPNCIKTENVEISSPDCIRSIKREIIESGLLGEITCTAGQDKDKKCLNNSLLLDTSKNGDINHNETSSELSDDEVADMLKPCIGDGVRGRKEPNASGRSTPSDLGEDSGTIRCENCLERIHTDEFVEHVRFCISKKSTSEVIGKLKAKLSARSHSCSDGDDECLSEMDDEKVCKKEGETHSVNGILDANCTPESLKDSKDYSPVSRRSQKSPKKPGSALKAMEHFIDNFNEKRLTKSQRGLKARSLLYDVPNVYNYQSISPQVGNTNHMDSNRFLYRDGSNKEETKIRSDSDEKGQSPKRTSPGSQNHSPKLERYDRHADVESSGSALHSLYKFASMDPRKVAPKLRAKLDQKPDLPLSGTDNQQRHSPQKFCPSPTLAGANDTNGVAMASETSEGKCEKMKNCVSPKREMDNSGEIKSEDRTLESTDEVVCDRKQNCESPESVKNPYLQVESPPEAKSKGSALNSLKGLVVKHMEKAEHPLNSLQKLINSTDGNHSPSITSLQTKLGRNGPAWYSMSGSRFSPNNSHSPHSRSESPGPERVMAVPGTALDLSHSTKAYSDHGSHNSSDSEDETKPSDLKCDLCGKVFSSKGGCRYHRSKCPQNVPRGMGGREARIVRTPYMYMPPEHTNKFSKYYEMARELANKSK